jgi:hypothetical protein
METLKHVALTPDQVYWRASPKQRFVPYRVVFTGRQADHFADNRTDKEHLPGAETARSIISSGNCLIQEPVGNLYITLFGLYNQRIYRIPCNVDPVFKLILPKTAYIANPNQMTMYAYLRHLRRNSVD